LSLEFTLRFRQRSSASKFRAILIALNSSCWLLITARFLSSVSSNHGFAQYLAQALLSTGDKKELPLQNLQWMLTVAENQGVC